MICRMILSGYSIEEALCRFGGGVDKVFFEHEQVSRSQSIRPFFKK